MGDRWFESGGGLALGTEGGEGGGGVRCFGYVPDGRVLGPALLKALGEEDEGSEEFEAAAHGSFVVVVGAKWCFCGCWRRGLRLVCWGDGQSLARKETGKKINVCEKEPCNSPWKRPATSRSGDLAWDATGLNLRSCRRRGSCLLELEQALGFSATRSKRANIGDATGARQGGKA